VTLTGKQKAAMLLMTLDSVTASELLKNIDRETVKDLAVELAYLDAAGHNNGEQSLELAREFYNSLQTGAKFHIGNFLNEMLKNTVGDEKTEDIKTQIQNSLQKRDPFINVRSADSLLLTSILQKQHPQAVAVVLGELDPKKSSEILTGLNEDMRLRVISKMTSAESVNLEAKARIAETINKRLELFTNSTGISVSGSNQGSRKIAVMLRNLSKELRDGLINNIVQKNAAIARKITNLMIIWEDLPQISDKSMQKVLRSIDAEKLAMALIGANPTIRDKIRSNLSEKLISQVDEEASMMGIPKNEDVRLARNEIIKLLAEMNLNGELGFLEK